MVLKRIIALENELNTQLDKYVNDVEVYLYKSEEKFTQETLCDKDATLLIAATDATIALGKKFGLATMAYENPDFPNQTYTGVNMLVEGFEEVDVDFLEKVYQRYHHIPWTILKTERCVVRELTLKDLDSLFELYDEEEISRFTDSLHSYEEEKELQRAYIENMYGYFGYGLWLVFSKETGELIGRAGLEHREYHDEIELDLGYVIGKKFQRQGYAKEVCEGILAYAKENAGFERINAWIKEGNLASEKLAQKLGFSHLEDIETKDGCFHRYVFNFYEKS
ncbi:MAG: GNAT family N-acetyltransferase [Agathobacter sp.]|nr:GNAT family N-acetyltransferase [Agathobacter sp.]